MLATRSSARLGRQPAHVEHQGATSLDLALVAFALPEYDPISQERACFSSNGPPIMCCKSNGLSTDARRKFTPRAKFVELAHNWNARPAVLPEPSGKRSFDGGGLQKNRDCGQRGRGDGFALIRVQKPGTAKREIFATALKPTYFSSFMAGRKPFTTTDVTPYGMGDERLRPPDTLGELERRAFVDLVLSVPVSQFQKCDLPLLCRWCELVVMAEQAAGEMRAQGMLVDGKQSPWFGIHQSACKELRALASRLRLGPSSRASRAPKTLPGNVSYYERMRLEENLDDADAN